MKLNLRYCLFLFCLVVKQRLSKSALPKDISIEDIDEAVVAPTVIEDYSKLESENIAVSAADSYSLYKQLMEVKQQLTSTNNTKQEPAAVTTLKSALSLLYDSIWEGVFKGFIPHVERQRRDAEGDRQVYLDFANNDWSSYGK